MMRKYKTKNKASERKLAIAMSGVGTSRLIGSLITTNLCPGVFLRRVYG